mmetsp:Transcript_16953/g.23326  ORF Transcript_16953/g.23326 Transcript_16953/m.23326 type:complete len:96 (-) Transcript_16953:2838-3125(-)
MNPLRQIPQVFGVLRQSILFNTLQFGAALQVDELIEFAMVEMALMIAVASPLVVASSNAALYTVFFAAMLFKGKTRVWEVVFDEDEYMSVTCATQ